MFLVAGAVQAADYSLVSRELPADCIAIPLGMPNLAAPDLMAIPANALAQGAMTSRTARQLIANLERLRRRYRRLTVVTGQDVGTLQRLALSWSRVRGCGTALLPDGIVFESAARNQHHETTLGALRAVFDRTRLVAGSPTTLGGSDPDLILSWGSQWTDLWRFHAPKAKIQSVGSPRFDELASAVGSAPPPNARPTVLLCSQPLWEPGFDATPRDIRAWYTWLMRSVTSAAKAGVEVRIRLHPRENTAALPADVLSQLRPYLSTESLVACLRWASHVLAPASTVVLEAAALNRYAALVRAVPRIDRMWQASPLFATSSWSRLEVDTPLQPELLPWTRFDAEPFLTNVGRAAPAAATALVDHFGT